MAARVLEFQTCRYAALAAAAAQSAANAIAQPGRQSREREVAAQGGKKDNARQWVEHWRAIEHYTGTFDVAAVPDRLFTDDLLVRAIGQAGVGG